MKTQQMKRALASGTRLPIGFFSLVRGVASSCPSRGGRSLPGRQWPRRFPTLAAVALLLALAPVGRWVSPADAAPAQPTDHEVPRCVSDLRVTRFTATPQTIDLGQSVPLSWNVQVPSGCSNPTLYLGSQGPQVVALQDTRRVQPLFNTIYYLRAGYGNWNDAHTIGSTSVTVQLPNTVTINSNTLVPLFLQALNRPRTTVVVENHVELNLSGRENIPIKEGVTLRGGRNAREPGPLLYTTTRGTTLFHIQGHHVRITGVRIRGPVMGVGSGNDNLAMGIKINSKVDIEIDHNELSGWSRAAVDISDEAKRIDKDSNPETIHIHDNYIHHNQYPDSFGYGVVIGTGAYALIERNVFDWNRHAIAGSGSDFSGYRAYANLVLEHGGYHCNWAGISWHTHQFDMHGQDSCWFQDSNCGTAGEYMDIRHNSFLYTAGAAIKLRGTPKDEMLVVDNVFAHDDIDDAVQQTERGLRRWSNQLGVNSLDEVGMCDFDGDGTDDAFLATGQTWWYSSGGQGHWVYLNTSTKRRHEVTLGQFDTDPRCDVFADGRIFSGGRPQTPLPPMVPGGPISGR